MDPTGAYLAGESFCRRCGRRTARTGQRMVRIAIRENENARSSHGTGRYDHSDPTLLRKSEGNAEQI